MALTYLLKVEKEGSRARPNMDSTLLTEFSVFEFIEINSLPKCDGQEHRLLTL